MFDDRVAQLARITASRVVDTIGAIRIGLSLPERDEREDTVLPVNAD
ncbi:hypothetical protein [Novosphingobium sp. Gsoil 351]|nr:hypothetical protein [Novosphingobium sp. Gsoil 351]QGN53186.1 hypothetical protein GKE62_00035 [Novosphingobium sp. Gsoil 351]